MSQPIPILVYHRIDDQCLSTSTAPHLFRQHLMWLSRHGWRSLSADEFSFYVSRRRDFPSRSFFLTFDDGYESIATAALPVLQELNFRAVCFATTRAIRGTEPTGAVTPPDEGRFLSWKQVRELQSGGHVEFQCHTHTHRRIDHFTPETLAVDLDTSLHLLSSRLALPRTQFNHLAWPWGESTPESRDVAGRCGIRYQYTVARTAFCHTSSPHCIPRTCYDGASYLDFQMQLWLQCGPLSKPWHVIYPVARKLRYPRIGTSLQAAPLTRGAAGHQRGFASSMLGEESKAAGR